MVHPSPRLLVIGVLAAVAVAVGPACRNAAAERRPEILVFAASSLTTLLPAIASEWSRASGVDVRCAFDASSRLARQVEEGAPADAVFFADEAWMDWLDARSGIARTSRVRLWTNGLAVVTRKGSGLALGDLQELTSASFHPIGVAEESVPAGRYARSALERRGIWEAVKGHLRQAENVRGVVAWASRGDVKVGIVYTSDAIGDAGIETMHVIPKSLHPEIVFPAAVTASSSRKKEAGAFIQFCAGESAREIARRHGFDPP